MAVSNNCKLLVLAVIIGNNSLLVAAKKKKLSSRRNVKKLQRQESSSSSYFESDEGLLFFSDTDFDGILDALAQSESSSDSHDDSSRSNLPESASLVESQTKPNSKIALDSGSRIVGAPNRGEKSNVEYVEVHQTHSVDGSKARARRPPESGGSSVSNDAAGRLSSKSHPKVNAVGSSPPSVTPFVRELVARYHRDGLLPVPRDYCADNFNLAHLPPIIERLSIQNLSPSDQIPTPSSTSSKSSYPIYREALQLITQDDEPEAVPEVIRRAARTLYFMIHQRYITSPAGLTAIRRRLVNKDGSINPIFGRCPRVSCSGMPLVPCSDSDNLSPQPEYPATETKDNIHTQSAHSSVEMSCRAKRYCGLCGETFYHWNSRIDGAAWGTSFCHLFLLLFGKELLADWLQLRKYQRHTITAEPRVFGFRVHPSAHLLQGSQSAMWPI